MTERPLAFIFDAPGWEPPSPPALDVCGGGRGAACCKFFMFGPGDAECARFTELHPMLLTKAMGSQFVPEAEDCQSERLLADV